MEQYKGKNHSKTCTWCIGPIGYITNIIAVSLGTVWGTVFMEKKPQLVFVQFANINSHKKAFNIEYMQSL